MSVNPENIIPIEDDPIEVRKAKREALIEAGLIKKVLDGVKVLGGGELTKKLTVSVDKVTEAAKQKIEAIGGKVEVK